MVIYRIEMSSQINGTTKDDIKIQRGFFVFESRKLNDGGILAEDVVVAARYYPRPQLPLLPQLPLPLLFFPQNPRPSSTTRPAIRAILLSERIPINRRPPHER